VNSKKAQPIASATNDSPMAVALPSEEYLPLVLTRNQTAKLLACCTRHLDQLTRRGLLQRLRLGRSIRYRRESVLKTLKKLEDAG
jgi:hypothetical protein